MNFEKELSKKVKETDLCVQSFLPESGKYKELIVESARYSVEAGGKRLRPLILKESFQLCGGLDFNIVKPFMAAIEFIHSYSLVHDDLPAMDNDDYRRGKLTTHKKFGEDFGILAGDALLNHAYETMLNAILSSYSNGYDKDIIFRMNKAAAVIAGKAGIDGMVGGQSLDVYLTGKDMNKDQLDYIFNLKTGALIEASFMAGGILAGADDNTVDDLCLAGHLVGVAFQIQDDILDIYGSEKELGKPVHSDEKNNKNTYVSLYGLDAAKKAVSDMSVRAENILKNIGDNEFLIQLVNYLINRTK